MNNENGSARWYDPAPEERRSGPGGYNAPAGGDDAGYGDGYEYQDEYQDEYDEDYEDYEDDYDEDYEDEYDDDEYADEDDYQEERPVRSRRTEPPAPSRKAKAAAPAPKKRKKRKKHWFRRILVLVLAAALALLLWGTPPQRGEPGRVRTGDRYNILLAGTDQGGTRTDTIMLLSLERGSRAVRLLSIPRDTYAPGYAAYKINSAYGAAGGGPAGMEELMGQVGRTLGFTPDAYALIDLNCLIEAVDLLGGADFDVPVDMHYVDESQGLTIDLRPGYQHLNGQQVMGLLRFRSGYATADIGRTEVQRAFIKSALGQWLNVSTFSKLPELWRIYRENVTTDLTARNVAWLARMLLKADIGNMQTDVLPGWADMVGGSSVYMIDQGAAVALLADYDPYR